MPMWRRWSDKIVIGFIIIYHAFHSLVESSNCSIINLVKLIEECIEVRYDNDILLTLYIDNVFSEKTSIAQ